MPIIPDITIGTKLFMIKLGFDKLRLAIPLKLLTDPIHAPITDRIKEKATPEYPANIERLS